jgi:uncharacterized protein YegP (UPF0339 family)
MQSSTITVYRDLQGHFYFRYRNLYNETLLTGESYEYKSGCLRAIAMLRQHARRDEIFRRINAYKAYRFYLHIPFGRILGNSRQFESEEERDSVIKQVSLHAPYADIVDASESVRFFRSVTIH